MESLGNRIKIILIGCASVGKTSLIGRWTENTFTGSRLSTIGAGLTTVPLTLGNTNYSLQVWDTAGQDTLRESTSQYFHGSNGAMVVFDITSRESFDEVSNWISLLEEKTKRIPIVIVGNKYDIAQENPNPGYITLEQMEEKAEMYDCSSFFVSAKSGYGVNEAFQTLASDAINGLIFPSVNPISVTTDDDNDNPNKKKKDDKQCCK